MVNDTPPMTRRLLTPLCLLLGLAVLPGCSTLRSLNPWDGNDQALAQRNATPRDGDPTIDRTPEGLYAAGVEALQARRFQAAVDLFDQVERDHPYSAWATNAKIMTAYGEYQRNRYTESVGALDRFISCTRRTATSPMPTTSARSAIMSRSRTPSVTSAQPNRPWQRCRTW